MKRSWLVRTAAVFALAPLVPATARNPYSNLYSFTRMTGTTPLGSLIEGANGVLYGTTSKKAAGYGSVYSLTPPAQGGSWTLNVLYDFLGGADGASPEGALVVDSSGNLYGTTSKGGTAGVGTVYMLTPPTKGSTSWTKTVLYNFLGDFDGSTPRAGLTLGSGGTLYGTADISGLKDGKKGLGTVFMLSPPGKGGTAWTQTVIHTFKGPDGAYPRASMITDASGALYGTTFGGGNQTQSCSGYDAHGCGTVFQLIPSAQGKANWTQNVLYAPDAADGVFINSDLIFDKNENLYGTAEYSNTGGRYGAVFEVSPGSCGNPALTASTLYLFPPNSYGAALFAGVIFGNDGALYGVSDFNGVNNAGTFFRLSPPNDGQGPWTETDLYDFQYLGSTVFDPTTSLLLLDDGTMVGTAGGGSKKGGIVYQVSP